MGVGILIAVPSSLPSSSGKTKPTAFAAPVEVGIIEELAVLALLKSLCSPSKIRGSEVEIAVEASKKLNEINVKARVVSMPCMELFNENNMEYRKTIFNNTKNIFIEAGTIQSWAQYMNSEDVFIGLKSFGLSGPAKDVYEYFQITVDRVIKEVTKVLNI